MNFHTPFKVSPLCICSFGIEDAEHLVYNDTFSRDF